MPSAEDEVVATVSPWFELLRLLDQDSAAAAAPASASATGVVTWAMLLDELDDAGALAYLRADDSGEELVDALAQLPRARDIDLGATADIADLEAATRIAAGIIARRGYSLVRLAEDDDAWALVVVRAEDAEEAVRIASSLGERIEMIG